MTSTTPKTMSSRLMTMKFMQRSAANSANSSPSTPNGPPSKRVRLSNGSSAPATPGTPSDAEVLQTALTAEEKKREQALERAAEQSGETKWVLSFQAPPRMQMMRVRTAGFAELDADEESDAEEEETRPARLQFGGGLPKKAVKRVATANDEDSEDDSGSSSEEFDSDDPTAELIRETKREFAAQEREARKTQKKTSNSESSRRPARPLDEDMDLGGLESLSGARRPRLSEGGRQDMQSITCFKCGQNGHRQRDCPKAAMPRDFARRGSGRR